MSFTVFYQIIVIQLFVLLHIYLVLFLDKYGGVSVQTVIAIALLQPACISSLRWLSLFAYLQVFNLLSFTAGLPSVMATFVFFTLTGYLKLSTMASVLQIRNG